MDCVISVLFISKWFCGRKVTILFRESYILHGEMLLSVSFRTVSTSGLRPFILYALFRNDWRNHQTSIIACIKDFGRETKFIFRVITVILIMVLIIIGIVSPSSLWLGGDRPYPPLHLFRRSRIHIRPHGRQGTPCAFQPNTPLLPTLITYLFRLPLTFIHPPKHHAHYHKHNERTDTTYVSVLLHEFPQFLLPHFQLFRITIYELIVGKDKHLE